MLTIQTLIEDFEVWFGEAPTGYEFVPYLIVAILVIFAIHSLFSILSSFLRGGR